MDKLPGDPTVTATVCVCPWPSDTEKVHEPPEPAPETENDAAPDAFDVKTTLAHSAPDALYRGTVPVPCHVDAVTCLANVNGNGS